MSLSGVFLRFGGTFLRILEFCLATIIMAIFAHFVDNIRDSGYRVGSSWIAVLSISAAAAVYTLFGVMFTLCLGGSMFFGNLAIMLDVAFMGAFIYVAYTTRGGSDGCDGITYTPLGNGYVGSRTRRHVVSSLYRTCQLDTVCFSFAVALCRCPLRFLRLERNVAVCHGPQQTDQKTFEQGVI